MSENRDHGMEEVVAARSGITSIDGLKGELRLRGYDIGDLAQQCTFEDVVFLLLMGELPHPNESEAMRTRLRRQRLRRVDLLDALKTVPGTAHPLDVLRYAVSLDALRHESVSDNTPAVNVEKATEMIAWFPTIVAALHRRKSGQEAIAPRPDLDTAANFLYMVHGAEASSLAVRTLDMSLVLHADHELNASTFAARVTIATQSNLHAAVASALGTLAGPRHGGASELVIDMLQRIGTAERAEAYVRQELQEKRRIMGYGHRVYRTGDPRARHLREMAKSLLQGTERSDWITILDEVTAVMQRERGLYPNVDLFAAIVNHELGIKPSFYTSIFACSRVAGWSAHAMEQLGGRMIRPVAEYVGPSPRSIPYLSQV